MKTLNWFFGLAIGVLAMGNVLFIYTTVHWRAEAFDLRKQNATLDYEKRWVEKSKDDLKQNVQAVIDSQIIAGIYEWENPSYRKFQELDLRSDGTGKFDRGLGGRAGAIKWSKANSETVSIEGFGNLKIENGDLIDEKGNRWLHIR